MIGFNSNFNDIQKQISFANLTDEQSLKLLSILQTKRSAKPKLTKEEKGFFQCCSERRSYSANKDLDTVVCPHCSSVKFIKNGTKNGRQRYKCKDCARTFGDTIGIMVYLPIFLIITWVCSIGLKRISINLTLNRLMT